jgi:hypothetical protein
MELPDLLSVRLIMSPLSIAIAEIDSWQVNLPRDICLLLTCPVEYLYSFSYPRKQTVHIEKFNPVALKVAKSVINRLYSQLPGVRIHFIGSVALGLSGMKDIDILVEADPVKFSLYVPRLTELFGQPEKYKNQFIEWKICKQGFIVEILVIDSKSRMFKLQMEVFKKLQKSKRKRDAYNKIKLEADGISYREYQRQKIDFYRRTLRVNHLVI